MNLVADTLELAADIMLLDGFAKDTGGAVAIEHEPRCTVGHIRIAACQLTGVSSTDNNWIGHPRTYHLFEDARNAMTDHLFGPPTMFSDATNLIQWNDADERTEDDVREAMLLTAKDLRNKAA